MDAGNAAKAVNMLRGIGTKQISDLGSAIASPDGRRLGVTLGASLVGLTNFGLNWFQEIHLNGRVNWADPNNTKITDQNGAEHTLRLLDKMKEEVGASEMTPEQLMDLTILHELAHFFDGDLPDIDQPSYDRNLWKNCFQ